MFVLLPCGLRPCNTVEQEPKRHPTQMLKRPASYHPVATNLYHSSVCVVDTPHEGLINPHELKGQRSLCVKIPPQMMTVSQRVAMGFQCRDADDVPNRRLGKDIGVSVDTIMTYLSGDDWQFKDILLWR